jgi:hypothetical protein
MKKIDGDLLAITDGIIVHQVNCQRKAGAGLALAISKMYPLWYQHFVQVPPHMGDIDLFRVNPRLRIASLFAQNRYGRVGVFTDYAAFDCCLGSLKLDIGRSPVYFPHGIGCGLAGGEWDVVEAMIEKHFPNATIVKKV